MAESFQQYIKIRTFLGYRPKEILIELQNAFGDEAPTYACVQRWSKRFRDSIDSPLGSPLPSQANFLNSDKQFEQQLDTDSIDDNQMTQSPINGNANQSDFALKTNEKEKNKRSYGSRAK